MLFDLTKSSYNTTITMTNRNQPPMVIRKTDVHKNTEAFCFFVLDVGLKDMV